MSQNFKTPGVYVEEVPSLPGSIVQVPTAIPVFIGFTELNSANTGTLNENGTDYARPTRIRSMLEYENIFGGPYAKFTYNPGPQTFTTASGIYSLYYHLQMYFMNGGGPCYIASIGDYSAATNDDAPYTDMLNLLKRFDEPTLILMPEAVELSAGDCHLVQNNARMHCKTMGDRFLIGDMKITSPANALSSDLTAARSSGFNDPDFSALYMPYINTTLSYPNSAIQYDTLGLVSDNLDNSTVRQHLAKIRELADAILITLPPSSAIAGIYCATDRERGVWKAPANVGVNGVRSLTVKISDDDQEELNVDATAGKSINAIRFFNGRGNMVWGSRTTDSNSLEWRYVPVRRLFIMMEESVKKAMEAMVFEPNGPATWARVKTMCENFLNNIWRDGGLAGAKPEHAYFVNVGLGTTMTENDLLEGRLIVEIGAAAVRPAEFIVLKFSHKLQVS